MLHDNGPLITHAGEGFEGADVSAMQSALGLNAYGFGAQKTDTVDNRLADDFEVTAPHGWQLDTVELYSYQSDANLTSQIAEVNFRIWDGQPGDPESTVVYGDVTTNSLLSSDFSGYFRVSDTALTDNLRPLMLNTVDLSQVYLPAGNYWLDVQFVGSPSASGPWVPPVTILGETITGDALQITSTTPSWNPAFDGGANAAQGIPFVLHGSEANLRLAGQALAVTEASSGDLGVPVLAFAASTLVAPGVGLNALDVQVVGADGATPIETNPVAGVKLYLDADLDGVPDAPDSPLALAVVADDGGATLDLTGVTIDAGTPVGFVVTYDLKGSLDSVALPVTVATLALLLPGLWLVRRRRAMPLVALGLLVALVGACSAPAPQPDPTVIEFRALVTGATAEVASGQFLGQEIGVDATGMLGATITVTY
ncbi:MAG: hypothetical protein WDA03_06770 [Trueperaceae bacterium]